MKHAPRFMLLLLLGATGCATKAQTHFYLVPDPRGHVGEVTVTNETGSATLRKANETVAAPRRDAAFSAPREAAAQEIQTKFAAAFGMMPPPPKEFSVYFESGSSDAAPESVAVLEQALAEARQRDSRDISVNGHADRTGDSAANMKLSLERAQKVRDLLVKEGIRPEYLSIEYYGESKPAVPTAKGASEPKNRRVEVVVR